jgi:hypothetical protein
VITVLTRDPKFEPARDRGPRNRGQGSRVGEATRDAVTKIRAGDPGGITGPGRTCHRAQKEVFKSALRPAYITPSRRAEENGMSNRTVWTAGRFRTSRRKFQMPAGCRQKESGEVITIIGSAGRPATNVTPRSSLPGQIHRTRVSIAASGLPARSFPGCGPVQPMPGFICGPSRCSIDSCIFATVD